MRKKDIRRIKETLSRKAKYCLQFSDLKRSLKQMSYNECMNNPEPDGYIKSESYMPDRVIVIESGRQDDRGAVQRRKCYSSIN